MCVLHLLRVSLLQQSAPKLVGVTGPGKVQPIVVGREEIVNDHFFPFPEVPKIESEHSAVTGWFKALLERTNLVEEIFILG